MHVRFRSMSQHPISQSVTGVLETIWQELLAVDSIDASDNFIALGGDSIAATLCVSRIQGLLGVAVPVLALLSDEGTFAGLAAHVDL